MGDVAGCSRSFLPSAAAALYHASASACAGYGLLRLIASDAESYPSLCPGIVDKYPYRALT